MNQTQTGTVPRAVLFDIGGVIVTDGPRMSAVAEVLGLGGDEATLERVDRAVWRARDEYDLGLEDRLYWEKVAAEVEAASPSEEALAGLVQTDVTRWQTPAAESVALVEQLAAAGVRLGVLSNAPFALARSFASQAWTSVFHSLTFSCDLGVAKPDPGSYASAVEALGVEPHEVVFFDDRPGNVRAAQECGLVAQVWTSAEAAAEFLGSCGLRLEGPERG